MRATNRKKLLGREMARNLAYGILGLFARPVLGPPDEAARKAKRERRKARRGRKRTLFSSRLGPLDPRPPSGKRWTPWLRARYPREWEVAESHERRTT